MGKGWSPSLTDGSTTGYTLGEIEIVTQPHAQPTQKSTLDGL